MSKWEKKPEGAEYVCGTIIIPLPTDGKGTVFIPNKAIGMGACY